MDDKKSVCGNLKLAIQYPEYAYDLMYPTVRKRNEQGKFVDILEPDELARGIMGASTAIISGIHDGDLLLGAKPTIVYNTFENELTGFRLLYVGYHLDLLVEEIPRLINDGTDQKSEIPHVKVALGFTSYVKLPDNKIISVKPLADYSGVIVNEDAKQEYEELNNSKGSSGDSSTTISTDIWK